MAKVREWGGEAHLPVPSPHSHQRLTGQCLGLPLQTSYLQIFQFSFSLLRKSEALDNVDCFCENPTALILVFIDHIKKLQLNYIKNSHYFPLAPGKLESEVKSAKCWQHILMNFSRCTWFLVHNKWPRNVCLIELEIKQKYSIKCIIEPVFPPSLISC